MGSWLLIQNDEENPVLAIINGNKETILEQLPNSIFTIDKEAYQYAVDQAMGEEECPWISNGCNTTCEWYNEEFDGCAINRNCDRGEEYWEKVATKYCCGDKKLAQTYPAKTEKDAEPLADFLAYNSCLRSLRDGFYKLIDIESINTLTINEE